MAESYPAAERCCLPRPDAAAAPNHVPLFQGPTHSRPEAAHLVGHDFGIGREGAHHLRGYLRLALADVVLAEQELAVEIAGLDRVQVDLVAAATVGGCMEVGRCMACACMRGSSSNAAGAGRTLRFGCMGPQCCGFMPHGASTR